MPTRREQTSESLLIAARVRRDPKVKAATQLARLPAAERDRARQVLAAWYGGSYRGADLTAAKTRRRRLTHERRAVLAVAGTPVETQPTSAVGVDRAWKGLAPDTRAAATAVVADLDPAADLSTLPPLAGPGARTDELEDFLAGPAEVGSRPLVESAGPPMPGAPEKAFLSDAELDAFLEGEGLEHVEELTGPGGGAGHWWKGGPGFADPDELRAYIEAEGFDWVAIAEIAYDGEEWRVWFPEESP
jgi:hypothetical protein